MRKQKLNKRVIRALSNRFGFEFMGKAFRYKMLANPPKEESRCENRAWSPAVS
jgi:hypothetical protein